MENIPHKIFLNLGEVEDVKNFNELSEISWSKERILDSDIEYLHGRTAFPVFDLLQNEFENGSKIVKQDGVWNLVDKEGDRIASGKTFRELLINLIFNQ